MLTENRAPRHRPWSHAHLAFAAVLCLAPGARGQEAPALGLILVSTEAEASELRGRVAGGESFDTLARLHSRDASAPQGGYLGVLRIGDLRDAFRAALGGLESGAVSAVTPLDGGYALLRVYTDAEREWIRNREAGAAALRDGRYADADAAFDAALRGAEGLGPRDARLGVSLNDRAELGRLRGNLAEAADFYGRAVSAWDEALGPGHASTASSLGQMAEIRLALGDHAAAAAFGRALDVRERVLGPGHSDVAATLNGLGLTRHLQGDYAGAREHFERALGIWESALGPDHANVASVLGNLAAVAMIESRHAEAERLVRRSLAIVEPALAPDHPEVTRKLEALAELRGLQGDWAEAARLYGQSLAAVWSAAPGRVDAFLDVVERFVDVLSLPFVGGAPGGAAARLDDAAASAALREDFYLAAGAILDSEGHAAERESILERAAARFPDSRPVRYGLAELDAGRGRIADALESLESAALLEGASPPLVTILKRRGDLLMEAGRLEAAGAAYVDASNVDPGSVAVRLALGNLHFRSNRFDAALAEFDEAARLDPGNPTVHYRAAETYVRMGRPAEAAAAAGRAVERDPDDRRAHYIRGRALMETGREAEGRQSLAVYARLEERSREENRRQLEISGIERDMRAAGAGGDLESAVGILEAGLERYPASYRLRLALGLVQSRAGLHRDSIRTLDSLIEDGLGDDAVVRKHLADAYRSVGDAAASERHDALFLRRILSELASALSR